MSDCAERGTQLTTEEQRLLSSFVAGGNRANVRGEWLWDDRSKALHTAVDDVIAAHLAQAFEAGYEKALAGVWYADATTPFEPAMFTEWLSQQGGAT